MPIRKHIRHIFHDLGFSRASDGVKKIEGSSAVRVATATLDFAVDGGATGAIDLGVYIPDNAIILRAYYDVVTTFTSASDTATIKLGLETQDDDAFVAAIAINDGTNPWDTGIHGTLVGFPALGADAAHDTALEVAALFAGTAVKMTDERQLIATVGTDALTAGKLNLFVEYVISD